MSGVLVEFSAGRPSLTSAEEATAALFSIGAGIWRTPGERRVEACSRPSSYRTATVGTKIVVQVIGPKELSIRSE
ncbi:MAG: hypothetical protein P8R42_24900 [Candidatus Binatia bacterium]|nr:hypothetical protein [Candidatus Binatia bacterium]